MGVSGPRLSSPGLISFWLLESKCRVSCPYCSPSPGNTQKTGNPSALALAFPKQLFLLLGTRSGGEQEARVANMSHTWDHLPRAGFLSRRCAGLPLPDWLLRV